MPAWPSRRWVYSDSMWHRSWHAPLGWLVLFAVSASALGFATVAHARGGSGAAVHVRGYVRKDGTYVAPHYRSAPDGNFQNNWSTKGNVNPYTGEDGTVLSPPAHGGGSRTAGPGPGFGTRLPTATEAAQPLAAPETVPQYHPGAKPLTPPSSLPQYMPPAEALTEPAMPTSPSASKPIPRQRKATTPAPGISRGQTSDLDRVNAAERRRNLNLCLHSGEAFCKREMLTPAEDVQFQRAELQRNLNLCLHSGAAFCKREMLTPAEDAQFQKAERRRNLDLCLHHGDAFCDRELLRRATSADR